MFIWCVTELFLRRNFIDMFVTLNVVDIYNHFISTRCSILFRFSFDCDCHILIIFHKMKRILVLLTPQATFRLIANGTSVLPAGSAVTKRRCCSCFFFCFFSVHNCIIIKLLLFSVFVYCHSGPPQTSHNNMTAQSTLSVVVLELVYRARKFK